MGDDKTYSLTVPLAGLLGSYSEQTVYLVALYLQYYFHYYTDVGTEPDLPDFVRDTVDLRDEYSDPYAMEAGYVSLINEVSSAWFYIKLTPDFEQVQHYIDYKDIEIVSVDVNIGVSIILYKYVEN